MKCSVCGKQLHLDYPHDGMMCDICISNKDYEEYCEMEILNNEN